jgi:predicted permease
MLGRLLNALGVRQRSDTDLRDELRFHLASLEEEHRRRGLSDIDARRAALRDFGGMLRTEERVRDQRGLPLLEILVRNVQLSLRSLRRTPVVALSVIATLAIGIGANTAIFSVVNGVLIKPLPYPDAHRVIDMSHGAAGLNIDDLDSSPFLYFTEREQNRTLEGVTLWSLGSASITGRENPEEVKALTVTADFFKVLGVSPLVGRTFTERDDTPGTPLTVVLAHGFWQRKFGGDPSVVGQALTMDGEQRTIVGVMPESFRFHNFRQLDVLTPSQLDRSSVMTGNYYWPSIARMKPDVTLQHVTEDVKRMIPLAIDGFPLRPGQTRQQILNSKLVPNLKLHELDVVGDAGNALWVVMGTLGMVLLVACANVGNLLLVRADGRQQELSIRAALGAGTGRLAGELLTESLLLSIAGGTLGIGVAFGALRLILALDAGNLPRIDDISLDSRALVFASVISLLSGVVFSLAPILRYAKPRYATLLRGGERSASGSREHLRARGALVVVQVALALVLLVASGLMLRTFQQLTEVDTGFSRAGKVQTVRVTIPRTTIPEDERTARSLDEILHRLSALPGVTSVAYANYLPLDQAADRSVDLLVPEGKVFSEGNRPKLAYFKFVSPNWFTTIGTPLTAGRYFTWNEVHDRRPVVLISENLARLEWGSPQNALGERLHGGSTVDQWREIIGVVGNTREMTLSAPPPDMVYLPVIADRLYNQPTFVARTVAYAIRSERTGAPGFLDEIRDVIEGVVRDVPLANVRTMEEIFDDSLSRSSFTLVMLAIGGGMALLLGVIGIYGVISYAVSQRTREVGIRLALGAESGQVQRMFIRQGLLLTGVGAVVGLAGAVLLSQWMSALLFEVSPFDPDTYTGVTAVLFLAAALASYVPARRTTRIDPTVALRAE